jgi:hypothetical protein
MLNFRVPVRVKDMSNINSITKIVVTKLFYMFEAMISSPVVSSIQCTFIEKRQKCMFLNGAIVYLLVHETRISKEDLAFLLLAGSKCHTEKKG